MDDAHVGALTALLEREIGAHGPMPFARFMACVLYEPNLGYYTRASARVGRAGDFVTAAAYPAFGRTLAGLLPMVQLALGQAPARMRVVDAGAGEGGLLASLLPRARHLVASPATGAGLATATCELEGVIVEPGEALRARARARVPGALALASLTQAAALEPAPGLVIANELLDTLPVRRFRRVGSRIEEAHVDVEEGRLVERWLTVSSAIPPIAEEAPRRVEVAVAAGLDETVAALAAAIERGVVLLIDYGRTAPVIRSTGATGNAVRGYRAGRLVDDLLASPGAIDLTAGVDFSAAATAAARAGLEVAILTEQTYLLLSLGFLEDADAAAAKRLIHPEDMGSAFLCMLCTKGIDPAAFRRLPIRDRRSWLSP